jgi:hypothetical protein
MIAVRTLARLLAGATLCIAVALAGAGLASADEDAYIKDLQNSGIDGPRAGLLSMGYQVCSDKSSGRKQDDTIANLTTPNLNKTRAEFLYTSALNNLCGR